MKLHLGCGKKNFGEDWIHIDGSNYSHIKYNDITVLPFENNSIDLIYASHVFEYFDRDECVKLLAEWKRVLKKDGILRLAVPDFKNSAKLYVSEKYDLDTFVGMFYGKWKVSDSITAYHKTIYDFKSLQNVLEKAGYRNIRLWDWRNVDHGKFDDYSQAYLPHMDKEHGTLISLNVECDN